jgi:hypothetical protein
METGLLGKKDVGLAMETLWKLWLSLFIGLETYAMLRHNGDTFSEWVWRWANVDQGWSIERTALLIFTVWLVGHLVWQKWA